MIGRVPIFSQIAARIGSFASKTMARHGEINLSSLPGMYAGGRAASFPLLLRTGASNSVSLNFTQADSSIYQGYVCFLYHMLPVTMGATLRVRASSDQGSSLRSGSEYIWGLLAGVGTAGATGSLSDTGISVAQIVHNASVGASGVVWISLAAGTYGFTLVSEMHSVDSAPVVRHEVTGGNNNQSGINGFGFLFSSGNISAGQLQVYGVPHT